MSAMEQEERARRVHECPGAIAVGRGYAGFGLLLARATRVSHPRGRA